jgi:hypothetical protein
VDGLQQTTPAGGLDRRAGLRRDGASEVVRADLHELPRDLEPRVGHRDANDHLRPAAVDAECEANEISETAEDIARLGATEVVCATEESLRPTFASGAAIGCLQM